MTWPQHLPAHQVRIARPTDRLDEVVAFYEHGLGLPRLGGFEDHVVRVSAVGRGPDAAGDSRGAAHGWPRTQRGITQRVIHSTSASSWARRPATGP